jgi:peptide/nickel transport system ATP-binding protein
MTVDNALHDRAPAPTPHREADTSDAVLRVHDLRVAVLDGNVDAVRGISLTVRRGEAVGLVGESGSGKTLTCRAALGVLPPGTGVSGGSVEFDGQDLAGHGRREWSRVRGRRVGAVFQDPASYLNPSLPVGRQLAEAVRVKLGLSRRAARARALELFDLVGLYRPEHVYRQLPHELSGGMLQRVLIAIAVSCGPDLLVADEATTALDVTIQAEVIELLRRLRDERGLAVLFVSHDLAVIAELCDRVVVCYGGEVVESGPTEEILLRPRHPYTRELVRVASLGLGGTGLDVIPGHPPAPGAAITGCWFAERCRFASDGCRSAPVPLTGVGAGHDVRCVRADALDLASEGSAS